jgi:hypothetical protein
MTENLTRRRLFGLAGTSAAGAAGLTLGGCSAGSPPGGGAAPAAYASAGQHFVSRPDLTPPRIAVVGHGLGADSRHVFLNAPYSGPGHGGTVLIDSHGELVWLGANTADRHRLTFSAQTYRGRAVLTWFEGLVVEGYGRGELVVADSSYRTIQTINAASGVMTDFHEFVITPQDTALVTAYRTHRGLDLSGVGGPPSGVLLSGVAQEIDIATGRLLFEWDSINYVPVTETYQQPQRSGDGGDGSERRPFNYFHINSLAIDQDGDLLVSSRNTWTVYKVSRQTGTIIWRMNGKKSDFTMGSGARFFWQHDARPHGDGVLTVFDNGALPAEEKQSRALILAVDTSAMHVTLTKAYVHPGRRMIAGAMGNAQLLPDGRMFVGWGTEPYFSEFAPDGRLLLDGSMSKGAPSYRAYTEHWAGRPAELPAAAARHRSGGATIYASWNGATDVAYWTVLAGTVSSSLTDIASARRTGFETPIAVRNTGPYFAVQPHDAAGHPLSRSAPVKIA